jgi:Spy/CpxP family protein refolding chaperone
MHPAVIEWWKSRHSSGGECEAWAGGCGPGGGGGGGGWGRRLREAAYYQASGGDDGEAGGFGVRRPLRFLAYKLDLDDRQVTELARILAELKTERAQAEVDRRRTLAAFADAIAADAFDDAGATAAGQRRVETAERLRDAVVTALKGIHAVLDGEQRQKLAYLIRTGTLVI